MNGAGAVAGATLACVAIMLINRLAIRGQSDRYEMQHYVTAIIDQQTGGFRGALYRNKPTPSGADRFLLSVSTADTHPSVAAAIEAMAEVEPDAPRHRPSLEVTADLVPPIGARVMCITDESGHSEVEVCLGGRKEWVGSALTAEQVTVLLARGILVLESSSGDDPELSCQYDTYDVVLAYPLS